MLRQGQQMPHMTMVLRAYLGKVIAIMYEIGTL